MQISEISFDLDDKNLFQVDDLKLRAEAIKNSILPKLALITNQAISIVSDVYKIIE